jgi:hypothetical protein
VDAGLDVIFRTGDNRRSIRHFLDCVRDAFGG